MPIYGLQSGGHRETFPVVLPKLGLMMDGAEGFTPEIE
jgi:hypothetical protein